MSKKGLKFERTKGSKLHKSLKKKCLIMHINKLSNALLSYAELCLIKEKKRLIPVLYL